MEIYLYILNGLKVAYGACKIYDSLVQFYLFFLIIVQQFLRNSTLYLALAFNLLDHISSLSQLKRLENLTLCPQGRRVPKIYCLISCIKVFIVTFRKFKGYDLKISKKVGSTQNFIKHKDIRQKNPKKNSIFLEQNS